MLSSNPGSWAEFTSAGAAVVVGVDGAVEVGPAAGVLDESGITAQITSAATAMVATPPKAASITTDLDLRGGRGGGS
ncbi:hypothetical protein A5784_16565 [Mycobacterium sp. 852013-50091_SCH5140682]|nr:hypothetical protein A5784_16565 [Mycobacterium sp. 852013-50091_SCH5140682]